MADARTDAAQAPDVLDEPRVAVRLGRQKLIRVRVVLGASNRYMPVMRLSPTLGNTALRGATSSYVRLQNAATSQEPLNLSTVQSRISFPLRDARRS